MKSRIALVLAGALGALLLVNVSASAQGHLFVEAVGGDSNDVALGITETSDGGYAVTGYREGFSPPGGKNFFLAKYKEDGTHAWSRTFGGNGVEVGNCVIETSSGALVAVGYTTSAGAGGQDVLLCKYSASGSRTWVRTWGTANNDVGNCVIETLDGNLAVVGTSENFGLANLDALFLAKFDQSGNSIMKTHVGGSLRTFSGRSVVETSSGFLVAGTVSGVLFGTDIVLVAFGPDNLIPFISKRIGDGRILDWEWIKAMVETSDGGFALTGYVEDDLAGASLFLIKLNSSVNIQWARGMGGPFPYHKYGNDVVSTHDGSIVVLGTQSGMETFPMTLTKWNASGTQLWSHSVDLYEGNAIIEDSHSGLVIAGYVNSTGAGMDDMLLAKFTSLGTTCLEDHDGPDAGSWPFEDTGILVDSDDDLISSLSWSPTSGSFSPTVSVVCDTNALCGDIAGTLFESESPYIVTCDVTVPAGERLTIEPGVQVLFAGQYSFTVRGMLLAEGTEEHPVVFTHYSSNPHQVWGGLRFVTSDPACRLSHCKIERARAFRSSGSGNGGGIFCDHASPTFEYCEIRGNIADDYGGGVFGYHAAPAFWYCNFVENSALGMGGAVACDGCQDSLRLENCVVVGNSSPEGCAVYVVSAQEPPYPASNVLAHNSIVWENLCPCPTISLLGRASFTATYCDIECGWPGVGNLDCDPLFDENYCPTWAHYPIPDSTKSCVIDMGDPFSPCDPDYTRADMGACAFWQGDASACGYLDRCKDDMYLQFGSPYAHTYAVRDGEWAWLPVFPPSEHVYFLMDMEVVDPPRVYYYGLLVAYDPVTCDTAFTIRLPQLGSGRNYSGLAHDPSYGFGSFWYAKLDKDSLCQVDGSGELIACYDIGHRNITGLAFDEENNHLWCIKDGAPDSLLEYDVNGVPVLLQAMPVPWETPGNHCAAGLDYDGGMNALLAVNKSTRTLECICDLDPAGAGGVRLETSCVIECDRPRSPYGVAWHGTAYVAGNPAERPYSLEKYATPCDTCRLPCPPAECVTAYIDSALTNVVVWFRAPCAGEYQIWSTTNCDYYQQWPVGFVLEDTVTAIDTLNSWTDPGALVPYKRYLIFHQCDDVVSSPSNEAACVTIEIPTETCPSSAYQDFGLPFQFWDVPANHVPTCGVESRKPSDIIDGQANPGTAQCADRIFRQETGASAFRNTAGTWTGSLETSNTNMDPGRAYWYVNKSGEARPLVLAGSVNDSCNYGVLNVLGPTIPDNWTYTPLSWRHSRCVPRNRLCLLQEGFTGGMSSGSDRVIAQEGGNSFWYRISDNTWQGSLTAVSPGNAYWIVNKQLNHDWAYDYCVDCVGCAELNMPHGSEAGDVMQEVIPPMIKPPSMPESPRR